MQGIGRTVSQAEARKKSRVASKYAWLTTWEVAAPTAWAWLRPTACMCSTAASQAGSLEAMVSDSRVWCRDSLRSQIVVASEAAKLPAVMRQKFDRPDAEGNCWGGTPFREMVTIDRKKVLIATPCTSMGQTRALKSTSGLNRERMKNDRAKA